MRQLALWSIIYVCLCCPLWAQQKTDTYFGLFSSNHDYSVKFGLLAPAFGFSAFYLEESLKKGRAIEYQANLIGLGENLNYSDADIQYAVKDNKHINQKGIMLGVGLKFIHTPKKNRYNMNGLYFKPTINLGYYKCDWYVQSPTSGYTKNIFCANLAATLGRQWLITSRIIVDVALALGLGLDNYNHVRINTFKEHGLYIPDNGDPIMQFGYVRMGASGFGLSGAASFKIGYLIHKTAKTN